MGQLRSKDNWSGTVVNGVTLGEPAIDAEGFFVWDGAVPGGEVDEDGLFDDGNEPPVAFREIGSVHVPEWVKPGPGDEIERGVVREANEQLWVSEKDNNSRAPGKGDWRNLPG